MTRRLDLGVLDALAAQPEGDVLVDRQVREQRVVLEDRVDVALVGRQPGHVLALELDQARRSAASNPPIIRRVVVLPQPDGPSRLKNSPSRDLEVDVVDGDRVAELLDHIHELDVDGRHWRSSRSPATTGAPRRVERPDGPRIGSAREGCQGRETRRPASPMGCEIRADADRPAQRNRVELRGDRRLAPGPRRRIGAAVRYRRIHRQNTGPPDPREGRQRRCPASPKPPSSMRCAPSRSPSSGATSSPANMVKDLVIDGAALSHDDRADDAGLPAQGRDRARVHAALDPIGVEAVDITWGAMVRRAAPRQAEQLLPGVKNVLAVASGKGGVGKSTVASTSRSRWRRTARRSACSTRTSPARTSR